MDVSRCRECLARGQRAANCDACQRWDELLAAPPADHTFRPAFYEHLGPTGEYVTSKRQLKELCAKYGVISHQLEF